MARQTVRKERIFKTAWFSKAAKKAHLSDEDLCAAIAQVILGQAVDLGGGVFKKRLGKNLYRSIVVAKGERNWIFVYLFAKKDQADINPPDLINFRDLASLYHQKNDIDLAREMNLGKLQEICDEDETDV